MPIFHQTGSLVAPLGKGCLMLEVALIPSENQDDACIQSHSVLPAREVGTDTGKNIKAIPVSENLDQAILTKISEPALP